jgi:hypothetical protein
MIKRLFNLYDDIFKKLKLEIYTDESGTIYGKWFDKNEKLIFSRNHFGTLWVDDCDSYTTLWIYSKALSLNKEEFELSLIDYLNLKYQNQSKNRPIKSIGDENHCLEDMEDETENLQESIRRILREETDFYYNLKTVAFEELPFEYQRSLIIYMYEGPVVDWSLDLDRDIVSKNDELVKVLINDYMSVGRNKNKSFAYGIVPMKTLTKEIAERMGYDNYNDYHKDYVGSNYVQKHKESVWPIILNPDNDELIEDGWHRFHDYYSRGLKKVPVVMFM